MQGFIKPADHVHLHVQARAESFGVKQGQIVVDYGCEPGHYAVEPARLVGAVGKVYAVDLLELALRETCKKLETAGFHSFELMLAQGYDRGIADEAADIVFAIDMFHHITDTDAFVREVYRIAKPDGLPVLSGTHMPRTALGAKIGAF